MEKGTQSPLFSMNILITGSAFKPIYFALILWGSIVKMIKKMPNLQMEYGGYNIWGESENQRTENRS